jgi:hypothetical protein
VEVSSNNNTLWKAAQPGVSAARQLFVNGTRMTLARTPVVHFTDANSTSITYKVHTPRPSRAPRRAPAFLTLRAGRHGSARAVAQRRQRARGALRKVCSARNRAGSSAEGGRPPACSWTASIHTIAEASDTGLTLVQAWDSQWAGGASGARFYLEGLREALDEPGEFYFDDQAGTVLLMLPPGVDPNTADCEVLRARRDRAGLRRAAGPRGC